MSSAVKGSTAAGQASPAQEEAVAAAGSETAEHSTGTPCLTALGLIVLHRCDFYNLKARPLTSQKVTTHFIGRPTLSRWAGTDPAFPRCSRNAGEADE